MQDQISSVPTHPGKRGTNIINVKLCTAQAFTYFVNPPRVMDEETGLKEVREWQNSKLRFV